MMHLQNTKKFTHFLLLFIPLHVFITLPSPLRQPFYPPLPSKSRAVFSRACHSSIIPSSLVCHDAAKPPHLIDQGQNTKALRVNMSGRGLGRVLEWSDNHIGGRRQPRFPHHLGLLQGWCLFSIVFFCGFLSRIVDSLCSLMYRFYFLVSTNCVQWKSL